MLHPDAMLNKTHVFSKYRHRRPCASPAGATLGVEPKLFYPTLKCFRNAFSKNTGPPEAMLYPDAMLSKTNFLFSKTSSPEAMR